MKTNITLLALMITLRSSLIMIRIYRNIIVFNSHNSYLNIVLIQVFFRTMFYSVFVYRLKILAQR